MSGTSSRQITGVAEAIDEELYKDKIKPLFSGLSSQNPESGWNILDYINVVVHIFLSPQREFYSLEHLWQDAKRLRIPSRRKRNEKRQTLPKSPRSNKRLSKKPKVK